MISLHSCVFRKQSDGNVGTEMSHLSSFSNEKSVLASCWTFSVTIVSKLAVLVNFLAGLATLWKSAITLRCSILLNIFFCISTEEISAVYTPKVQRLVGVENRLVMPPPMTDGVQK